MHHIDPRTLRSMLDQALRTDADFDAFVIDHFPAVKKRFSGEMSRTSKVNLLFECVETGEIATQLYEDYKIVFADHSIKNQPPRLEQQKTDGRELLTYKNDRFRYSPWLDTLKTYRGSTQLVLANLGAIGVLVYGSKAFFPQQQLWLATGSLLVSVIALSFYVRAAWHRKQVRPVSLARFVGPQPMTKTDRERRGFYGRDDEIENIVSKLSSAEIRHLILLGESGCGKTSLLLAGVIPELEAQAIYHPIYLRFSDHPVQSLRTALRAGLERAIPDMTSSPIEALRATWAQVQKPIILFIDQFEEFHINQISEADYQAIQELVWAVAGRRACIDAKIVFCLRYDFLHMMDVFYDENYVNKDFANGEVRIRIEPFEAKIAEEVVCKSLMRSDGGGLEWSASLIRRVLDDLTMERIIHGQRKQIVLPSELQIVFQMVHAKRIVSADAYPGKRQLLIDYISEAIDTTPGTDPSQARQLLLGLIDVNGVTRAKPQTLEQLAAQLRQDPLRLRRMLDHLDRSRHIVRSFSVKPDDGPITVVYELGHDYLAGLIRTVAGQELLGVRYSQAILHGARMQCEYNPSYRLSLRECWQLMRYPAAEMTSDDRSLVRRSVRSLAFGLVAPIALVMGIGLFLRFGMVHIDFDRQHLVVRRGLPLLPAVLSARRHHVETGLVNTKGLANAPVSQTLFHQLRNNPLRPQFFSFLNPNWDIEVWLRQQLRRVATAAILVDNEQSNAYLDDSEFIALLIALELNNSDTVMRYEKKLLNQFDKWAKLCPPAVSTSTACDAAARQCISSARNLYRLRLNNPNSISYFRDQIQSQKPESWSFSTAYAVLNILAQNDLAAKQRIIKLLNSATIHQVALLLTHIELPPQDEKSVHERIIKLLWVGLSELNDRTERNLRLKALAKLGLPNRPMVDFLYAQHSRPLLTDRLDALRYLLVLKVRDEKMNSILTALYRSAAQELSEIGKLDSEATEAVANPEMNPNLFIVIRLLSDSASYEGLIYPSVEVRTALNEYMAVDIKSSEGMYFRTNTLLSIVRQAGVPLREIVSSLPDPSLVPTGWSRGFLRRILEIRFPPDDWEAAEKLFADRSYQDGIEQWVRLSIHNMKEGCAWANIALSYRISHPALEQRLQDPECADSVSESYALRRLLERTAGFDAAAAVAGGSSYQAESQAQAATRLLGQLDGPQATESLTYRTAVIRALRFLVEEQRKRTPDQAKQLLNTLRMHHDDPRTPLHVRLSLAREFYNFAGDKADAFACCFE